MDVLQNIELFQELVRCSGEISLWRYDGEGSLLASNCPDEVIYDTAFSLSGCRARMLDYAAAQDAPVLLGTEMGLIWGAAFEKREGKLYRAYTLGPVFFSDTAFRQIRDGLASYQGAEVSIAWKSRFIESLPRVPVSQHIVFSRYILMLHYCLTGKHLQANDLSVLNAAGGPAAGQGPGPHRDRYLIWNSERALLQMVRNGDLNYKSALQNSTTISNGVPLQGGAPLRQAKNSVIVFCSIVCRAAIEGGLSPEEAYSLGDTYIQSAEHAKRMDELTGISLAMYDDFIRRVHRCRNDPARSDAVQKCCDYIEMNLSKKIRAADLAALAGYSEYYITRKFKAETGFFINDYIKFAKMERAKLLLRSTDQTVLDIAEQLGFATRSYFSQAFRAITGMTPTQFRERER
ncbi:MAG: AraC family transcriptional regulator [Oscillospiraceae bacterium]|nr:AraC family transcriptional regulator [Oscillospiraceae bacterium]